MSDYESYEQFLDRKAKEEQKQMADEAEEREWKRMEQLMKQKQKIKESLSHHDIVKPSKIYESPDGGKTIYARDFGKTKRERVYRSPEEQKINDHTDTTDMVNHPPHYNKGIETTTYIDSWDMGFSQGNVVKYVTRYNLKHDAKEKQLEDLKKARWYLDDLIKMVEKS